MCVTTFNRGHVALGNTLSITNGTPYEVRLQIEEREARDKARRKGMASTRRKNRVNKPFVELKCPSHLEW